MTHMLYFLHSHNYYVIMLWLSYGDIVWSVIAIQMYMYMYVSVCAIYMHYMYMYMYSICATYAL